MEGQRDGEAVRQYYLAVDRQQFKMGTLVDLLGVLGGKFGLPIVMCCSSRDVLDALCAAISILPYISLSSLHSDLAEVERASSIEKFRQLVNDWSLMHEGEPEGFHEEVKKQNSHILVVTDSCLPMQALGEAPLSAQVLINYDLPAKKEAYLRRLAACTSGIPFPVTSKVYGAMIPGMTTASTSTINHSHGAIVINMVVGGEIVKLKNIEEGCGIVIEEMPMDISELL